MPSLEEWNQYLVDVLFPIGEHGKSRLFLTEEYIAKLMEKSGLADEDELFHALFTATSADDLSHDLNNHVLLHLHELMLKKNMIKAENPYLKKDEVDNRLKESWVEIIPQFLAHLVVIVRAYMTGDEESSSPYSKIIDGIVKILPGLDRDVVGKNLRNDWPKFTGREYVNQSPWEIMKRWFDNRATMSANGAMVLDTRDISKFGWGKVKPIMYHAPLLSEDRRILLKIGAEQATVWEATPMEDLILEQVRKERGRLSPRARNTILSAFDAEKRNEAATYFVPLVLYGYHNPEEVKREGFQVETLKIQSRENEPRVEITLARNYYDDYEMRTYLVDVLDNGEEFVLNIEGRDYRIPPDEDEPMRSQPLELHLPDEVIVGMDMDIFTTLDVRRGEREFSLSMDYTFKLQLQGTTWSCTVPSSGQEVLLVSSKARVEAFLRTAGISNGLKEISIDTVFKFHGTKIFGVSLQWQKNVVISRPAEFLFKGGIKAIGGGDRYLRVAPPMLVYRGSQAPDEFVVQIIEPKARSIVFRGGSWNIEPVECPCSMLIKVESNSGFEQELSIELVDVVDGKWRDFFRKNPEEYEDLELKFDMKIDWPAPWSWVDHLEHVRKNQLLVKEHKEVEPFWMSYESALEREKQLNPEPEPIPDRPVYIPTPKPRPEPKKPEPVVQTYMKKLKSGCSPDCICVWCKQGRHVMKNPNDDKGWDAFDKNIPKNERPFIIRELKEKFLTDKEKRAIVERAYEEKWRNRRGHKRRRGR